MTLSPREQANDHTARSLVTLEYSVGFWSSSCGDNSLVPMELGCD